jgi:phosphatidylglycerol---prolipoprotein diacylglyceryl transferase
MVSFLPSRTVFLEIFGFPIRWYGVLYVVAFALAWRLLPRLQRYRSLTLDDDAWLAVLTAGMAGVLAGGRLGYALFYEPNYFLAQPLRLLFLWDGGMSSHGGVIGVALALWLVSRRLKIDLLALADVAIVPAALGLALGRFGNFINQELYVSTAAHLAAIAKDLLIAGAAFWQLRFSALRQAGQPPAVGRASPAGGTVALFLVMYGILRFLTEYVRVPALAPTMGLTRGQWLTLPVLAAGVLLMVWLRSSKKKLT